MKRILVAPLNWGLGHATRCIPIINSLIDCGFEPIIASDGAALDLLRKEFPQLKCYELPSYNITYSKKGQHFKLKLIKDTPHLLKTIKKEKKATENLVTSENLSGIISDNRFGVRHSKVPSVFMTHQLQVLSGSTTKMSSFLHQNIINKFDQCWVPDFKENDNLSGKLGRCDDLKTPVKYIGPLSRFKKKDLSIKHKLLVLLSGPEPQRSILEEHLLKELSNINSSVLFVKGVVEEHQIINTSQYLTIYNFMTARELERAINSSEMVLSRSGYTTIMDLAKLGKKAFFIPTPGQFEQEYLAKKFELEGVAPFNTQEDFSLKDLELIEDYSGFKPIENSINFIDLLSLF